jgi:hypothetical protein
MPNLKLRPGVHHWNDVNGDELTTLSVLLMLQGLHKKSYNKRYFSRRKILKTSIFLVGFTERLHLLLRFHFVDSEAMMT